MSDHTHETPLGGKIITPGMLLLAAIIGLGGVVVLIRLWGGLGTVGNMSDGYPWGIWKPLNVVTFTGIAAGAYAVGILTYIFNKGEYHPLMRSAVMAGAMGYTLAGTSVLVDLGRYWNLWVVFWPPVYQLNSVLLEVSICVMSYCIVLWIEVSPAVMEYFAAEGKEGWLKRWSTTILPWFKRALPFVVSIAILLPTMHQSSLGGLYMITVTKLHGLWQTPWVSGLFLISCLTMGFGGVVLIENITDLTYDRKMDQKLLSRMAMVPCIMVFVYAAIRIVDIAMHHRLGLIFKFDFYSIVFLVEMALFLGPAFMLLSKKVRESRSKLLAASILLILSGAMYRFDTYLTAYLPIPSKAVYFPSVGETLFSLCLAAVGVLVYVVMSKLFPIVSGVFNRKPLKLY